jgi:5-oxoprolinase (ATP-hydrolysing)
MLKEGESLPSDSQLTSVVGSSRENLLIEKPIDKIEVRSHLQKIYDQGVRSIAVVFLHSYMYDKHELIVREIAIEIGFEQISLSSEVMKMVKMVPRGCTTCVDAYLTPVIKRYLASFSKGFDAGLQNVNISFMQSDGGLTPMDKFLGNKAILSGPAGGVVGYAMTSFIISEQDKNQIEKPLPVIGFDMGGTSTDVSRFDGNFEHVFESTTAGVTIQSPQLDINTVAAGGGSRLFYRNNLFVVGPESAGIYHFMYFEKCYCLNSLMYTQELTQDLSATVKEDI